MCNEQDPSFLSQPELLSSSLSAGTFSAPVSAPATRSVSAPVSTPATSSVSAPATSSVSAPVPDVHSSEPRSLAQLPDAHSSEPRSLAQLPATHLARQPAHLIVDSPNGWWPTYAWVGDIHIRPFVRQDAADWAELRNLDANIIRRREATAAPVLSSAYDDGAVWFEKSQPAKIFSVEHSPASSSSAEMGTGWQANQPMPFGAWRRFLARDGKKGNSLVLALQWKQYLVGYLSVNPVQWGSTSQGTLGYWVASRFTNNGIAGLAVASVLDILLGVNGLNRVEVLIEPNNGASLAVARRLRIPFEGVRRDALWIDGAYRDHLVFAAIARDLSNDGTWVRRWFESYRSF